MSWQSGPEGGAQARCSSPVWQPVLPGQLSVSPGCSHLSVPWVGPRAAQTMSGISILSTAPGRRCFHPLHCSNEDSEAQVTCHLGS